MRKRSDLLLSRRHLLGVPVLAALAGALTACGDEYASPKPPATGASGGSTPGAPASGAPAHTPAAVPVPAGTTMRIDNLAKGKHSIEMTVGPVIRVDDSSSLLKVVAHRPQDDPGADEQIYPPLPELWLGSQSAENQGTRPLRLVDTANRRVWVSTQTAEPKDPFVEKGDTNEYYFSFGAIDAGTTRLVAMLSETGFFEVEVVEAATVPGVDGKALVAAAAPEPNRSAPLDLEFYARAFDGSSGSLTTSKDVTLSLSGDVTFATDSADLSATADAGLQVGALLIKAYPDGGSMTITGHTDDVAEDAYNLTLSEKRAQTVHQRLGELVDLSKWQVEVVGKGETEPKINDTTEEARAANRRVEVVLTPTGGTKLLPKPDGAAAQVPEPKGPSATGAAGVKVVDPHSQDEVTIYLDQVTRRGQVLLGEFRVVGGKVALSSSLNVWFRDSVGSAEYTARGEKAGLSPFSAASGVTLAVDGQYVFPLDYLPLGADGHRPLAELDLDEYAQEGKTYRVLVVWPDTGGSTVTVDRADDRESHANPWRLTDVPVVEA